MLRAVTMVVEFVSFMASTSKFWFIAILHYLCDCVNKLVSETQSRVYNWPKLKSPKEEMMSTVTQKDHTGTTTTFMVSGGRFFLQDRKHKALAY